MWRFAAAIAVAAVLFAACDVHALTPPATVVAGTVPGITFVDNATLVGGALAPKGVGSLGTKNVVTLP